MKIEKINFKLFVVLIVVLILANLLLLPVTGSKVFISSIIVEEAVFCCVLFIVIIHRIASTKSVKEKPKEIAVGDRITSNGYYPSLKDYFRNGPLTVTRIEPLATYDTHIGGKFVFAKDENGKEFGFYINGLKKI